MKQLFLFTRRDDATGPGVSFSGALRALDRHLHEPGVAFTSTHAGT
ncbi:CP4-6 prophage; putative DNA repair protein [Escherichia coli]|nr:CP4-6 prophage; putative DNA repair protein [Escherichia coli]